MCLAGTAGAVAGGHGTSRKQDERFDFAQTILRSQLIRLLNITIYFYFKFVVLSKNNLFLTSYVFSLAEIHSYCFR